MRRISGAKAVGGATILMVFLIATGACSPPAVSETQAPSTTSWQAKFDRWLAEPVPVDEECRFQGEDVVCVTQWNSQPPTTDVFETPTLDQEWVKAHRLAPFPPRVEPGREQYLTPYEESLGSDFRPFPPIRHCPDNTMWDPKRISSCPDGSAGTITWIHHDGTVVEIGPGSPKDIRWGS